MFRNVYNFSLKASKIDLSINMSLILNVKFYKIASVDLVNLPLIEKVGKTGKPLILSTGMSSLGIVEEAIERFKKTRNKN